MNRPPLRLPTILYAALRFAAISRTRRWSRTRSKGWVRGSRGYPVSPARGRPTSPKIIPIRWARLRHAKAAISALRLRFTSEVRRQARSIALQLRLGGPFALRQLAFA